MNNWQKVINVSLAVIVTLLIYQNQQLENEILEMDQNIYTLEVVVKAFHEQ